MVQVNRSTSSLTDRILMTKDVGRFRSFVALMTGMFLVGFFGLLFGTSDGRAILFPHRYDQQSSLDTVPHTVSSRRTDDAEESQQPDNSPGASYDQRTHLVSVPALANHLRMIQKRKNHKSVQGIDFCLEEEPKYQLDSNSTKDCKCPDPTSTSTRETGMRGLWLSHHKMQAEEAAAATKKVDVVLFGDSLTERWRGTWLYGKKRIPEIDPIFQRYFNKRHNTLALGSSGDVTTETFWHLKNGFLPNNLHPKIFVLLIGTNDLDRNRGSGCSKESVVEGILTVVGYIQKRRPKTPILIQGLLPRDDTPFGEKQEMGVYWKQIQWINKKLKDLCEHSSDYNKLFFAEYSDVFLGEDTGGQRNLKKEIMQDGVHPSPSGYEKWAPLLLQTIDRVLKEDRAKSRTAIM